MTSPVVANEFYPWLLVGAGVALAAFWLMLVLGIGAVRGTLAMLCRAAWLAPLFISFFPETQTRELPNSLTLKPVHILLDDSQSMTQSPAAPMADALKVIKDVEADCARLGCIPKVTRLSELDDDTKNGYTPLSNVVDSWLYKVGSDPWLLVSDGADYQPTEKWPQSLKNMGRALVKDHAPRGLVLGFRPKNRYNVWVKSTDVPPFSFEGKPFQVVVTLRHSAPLTESRRVQVQVLDGAAPLATANAEFRPGEWEAEVTTTVPPLPRGQHLLTVHALPTAEETTLWDNTVHVSTEVLPNTVGVLHLLGSPSWDGRFLRRYLKSEPKYDLISFFILRDPWDSQQVNERELSLIPFPVERLFREELPNFRVVVIQNFTLFQFLLPEYQNNLVKFVQDGGGLLFIGGPRALTSADLGSSPLKQILPFEVANVESSGGFEMGPFGADFGGGAPAAVDDHGPAYDPNLEFRVEMAKPEPAKRALANVYEDWEALAGPLTAWRNAKGLHHMERMKFKSDTTTVLLNARPKGAAAGDAKIPLAVASYPGKGRAIWLFSDSFYRLALAPADGASRQVYNQFMQGAMTWLMRQDLRQPLVAKNFALHGGRKATATWRVTIQGPAARYYQPSAEWKLTVCNTVMPPEKLAVTRQGADAWELAGPLPVPLAGGERCTLELEGAHAAFGSVKTQITAVMPEIYKDADIDASPQKLEDLATLTGAALAFADGDSGPPVAAPVGAGKTAATVANDKLLPTPAVALAAWTAGATGQDGVALPGRFKTFRNFFWVLDRPWFWLLLLAMPCEVIIRRWDQLLGAARVRSKRRLQGMTEGNRDLPS